MRIFRKLILAIILSAILLNIVIAQTRDYQVSIFKGRYSLANDKYRWARFTPCGGKEAIPVFSGVSGNYLHKKFLNKQNIWDEHFYIVFRGATNLEEKGVAIIEIKHMSAQIPDECTLAEDILNVVSDEGTPTARLLALSEFFKATDIAEVRKLINDGADVNVINRAGGTPLIGASMLGYTEIVIALLKANADVNVAMKESGLVPLHFAARLGKAEIVTALLEAKADVNIALINDGRTPLYMASRHGHTAIVKLLLDAKANVNAVRVDGSTPLFVATQNGHTAIVKLLKDHGAIIKGIKDE